MPVYECRRCEGTGMVRDPRCNGDGKAPNMIGVGVCKTCNGTGEIPCTAPGCDGTGMVRR
jgi:DnaJ-class molecular chaperone